LRGQFVSPAAETTDCSIPPTHQAGWPAKFCGTKHFLAGGNFFVKNTESRFLGSLWRPDTLGDGEIFFLARGIEWAALAG
jgi:hypothetical protein